MLPAIGYGNHHESINFFCQVAARVCRQRGVLAGGAAGAVEEEAAALAAGVLIVVVAEVNDM